MVIDSARDWDQDRERFVEHFRRQGPGSRGGRVADDRARIWSPLARQFGEIGRDLLAVRTAAEVAQRAVALALDVVPVAALASVTVRMADGHLCTPGCSDHRAPQLDELQDVHGRGPFETATRRTGAGMASSPDLLNEPAWSEFGRRAEEMGIRSVLAVGMFPVRGKGRLGAFNVFASEPRGLAAADPSVLLVLASFAAAALATSGALTEEDMVGTPLPMPVRSSEVIERATEVLLERCHLSAEEAYDILRRSSADLLRVRKS
ncbi:ANTAR domain-containing protein [Parasphingorhabdus pacifica]